jgi:alpha-tubulin suppressor-like RCC1 family protein
MCLSLSLPTIATGAKASAVSAGVAYTCAVTNAGGAKCWGYNFYGQLGDGTETNRSAPVDVSGLTSGVTAISAGAQHTCALTSAGGVKCWGDNSSGELGDGTTTRRLTPVDVSGLNSGVVAISAGGSHTCALTSAGGVKCWGANGLGELGDGTATGPEECPFSGPCSTTPVDVSGLTSGGVAISADGVGACAVTSTGGAKCWGFPAGDGTFERKTTPVDVSGLTSGVAAISMGQTDACALTSAGGGECWGDNSAGELGDGTFSGPEQCGPEVGACSSTPVVVSGLTNGVAISAGQGHACAVTSGGGAKCWGYLTGDGTDRDKASPVGVSGLTSGVAAISAGESHTCAVTSTGGIECWGWNQLGQLGDGTTSGPENCKEGVTCSLTPIDVSGLTSGSCTTNSGSIKLSPGVTNTPAVQTMKIKAVLSGCSGARFTGAKYTATLTTAGPVSCSTLSGTGETASGAATYKWMPKAKPSPGTSTGALSLALSNLPGTAFSGEVMNGPESQLALAGTTTASYSGTCAPKAVQKGRFSGSAVSFE